MEDEGRRGDERKTKRPKVGRDDGKKRAHAGHNGGRRKLRRKSPAGPGDSAANANATTAKEREALRVRPRRTTRIFAAETCPKTKRDTWWEPLARKRLANIDAEMVGTLGEATVVVDGNPSLGFSASTLAVARGRTVPVISVDVMAAALKQKGENKRQFAALVDELSSSAPGGACVAPSSSASCSSSASSSASASASSASSSASASSPSDSSISSCSPSSASSSPSPVASPATLLADDGVAALRIASFNIPVVPFDRFDQQSMTKGVNWGRNSWERRKHLAAQQILSVMPHVMGLQEIRDRGEDTSLKEKARFLRVHEEELESKPVPPPSSGSGGSSGGAYGNNKELAEGDMYGKHLSVLMRLVQSVNDGAGSHYEAVEREVHEPIIYDSRYVAPLWRGKVSFSSDTTSPSLPPPPSPTPPTPPTPPPPPTSPPPPLSPFIQCVLTNNQEWIEHALNTVCTCGKRAQWISACSCGMERPPNTYLAGAAHWCAFRVKRGGADADADDSGGGGGGGSGDGDGAGGGGGGGGGTSTRPYVESGMPENSNAGAFEKAAGLVTSKAAGKLAAKQGEIDAAEARRDALDAKLEAAGGKDSTLLRALAAAIDEHEARLGERRALEADASAAAAAAAAPPPIPHHATADLVVVSLHNSNYNHLPRNRAAKEVLRPLVKILRARFKSPVFLMGDYNCTKVMGDKLLDKRTELEQGTANGQYAVLCGPFDESARRRGGVALDGYGSHEDEEEEAAAAAADDYYSSAPPCLDTWEMAAARRPAAAHANGCWSSTCHGFYGLDPENQRTLVGTSAVGCNRMGVDEAASQPLHPSERPTTKVSRPPYRAPSPRHAITPSPRHHPKGRMEEPVCGEGGDCSEQRLRQALWQREGGFKFSNPTRIVLPPLSMPWPPYTRLLIVVQHP